MLSNSISVNDIITIKLISGEEIIAKYIEQDVSTLTVSKPLLLAQQGNGMILAPYILTAEKADNIKFFVSAISTFPTKTQPQVKMKYIEFTTGITTSPAAGNVSSLITD